MSSSEILPAPPLKSLLKDPNRVTSPTSTRRVTIGSTPKKPPKFDFSKIVFPNSSKSPSPSSTLLFNPKPIEITPPILPSIPTIKSTDNIENEPTLTLSPPEPESLPEVIPHVTDPAPPPAPLFQFPLPQVLPARSEPVELPPAPMVPTSLRLSPLPVEPTILPELPARLEPVESPTGQALPAQPSRPIVVAPPRPTIQSMGYHTTESQLFGGGVEVEEPEPEPIIVPPTLYRQPEVMLAPVENVLTSGTILVSDTPRVITPTPTLSCSSEMDEGPLSCSFRSGSPIASPPGSPSLPCPTSPSRPISPVCKSNDISLVRGECFETILRGYGYTPISKLIVRNQDRFQGEYIKCLDRLGNYVYVRLDITGGYISVNNQDLVIEQTHEVSEIPYSTLHTYKDESFLILHGVAVHCKRGICFIRRHHDGSVKTEHFLYSHVSNREVIKPPSPSCVIDVMDSSLLAFPVVNLSEIKANIAVVVRNTDNLSTRLANHTYKQCAYECQKLEESVARLDQACKEFKRLNKILSDSAKDSTNHYRIKIRETLSVRSQRDPTFVKEYSLILYNLQRRQELMAEFLHGSRAAGFLADQTIESATRDIRELNQYMQTTFAGIDTMMRP